MLTRSDTFPLVKFEAVNRPMVETRRIFEERIADALHTRSMVVASA